MNEAIVFDTHRFIRNLIASGFTERQAEALADEQAQLLNGNLATKADLATVKSDLEVKIANVKSDLLKWMFAALIAQGGVIVTLVTLL